MKMDPTWNSVSISHGCIFSFFLVTKRKKEKNFSLSWSGFFSIFSHCRASKYPNHIVRVMCRQKTPKFLNLLLDVRSASIRFERFRFNWLASKYVTHRHFVWLVVFWLPSWFGWTWSPAIGHSSGRWRSRLPLSWWTTRTRSLWISRSVGLSQPGNHCNRNFNLAILIQVLSKTRTIHHVVRTKLTSIDNWTIL